MFIYEPYFNLLRNDNRNAPVTRKCSIAVEYQIRLHTHVSFKRKLVCKFERVKINTSTLALMSRYRKPC